MQHEPTAPPKRSYTKREKAVPTIAYYNEQIEAKKLVLQATQAEIDSLIAKRNELYFDESTMMGLIDLMADPEKAKWLADKVNAYNGKQN